MTTQTEKIANGLRFTTVSEKPFKYSISFDGEVYSCECGVSKSWGTHDAGVTHYCAVCGNKVTTEHILKG